jgi:hypothetical protein
MFKINSDQSIYITRGDVANIEVGAKISKSKSYIFRPGDVLEMEVFEKCKCSSIVLRKVVQVLEESPTVDIYLNKNDTRIGEMINKPKDYWYEIVLNPETEPQTIVGYDEDGPKLFRLFPEGSESDGD